MRNLILLLFLGICSLSITAQPGMFAFADIANGRADTGQIADHKYETAKMVFDSLVEGLSYFPRRRPTFLMKDSEINVAWAIPEKAEIGLEELAYDICASFGPDSLKAMAALLSHELVHYYKEHEWSRHFAKENQGLTTAEQLAQLEEGLKLEAQADYQGGFLAYSVGFDIHNIMPELLRKVYSEEGYDLGEGMPGYPSLSDRIAMSENAMKQLMELQLVYETATYLNILEEYEVAEKYYDYIIKDFKSREIYNNAGVTALLAALPFFSTKERPYALPVELDPDTRLRQRTTRSREQDAVRARKEHLDRALKHFEWALRLDEHYAPAYMNTMAAYILLGDWDEAEYWLRKARKKVLKPQLKADLLVLEGVLAAHREERDKAEEAWTKAQAGNSHLAELNLQVLRSGSLASEPRAFGFGQKKEQVNQLDVDKFVEQNAPDFFVLLDERTACGLHQRPESRIYSHSVDFGKEYVKIQVVGEDFEGATLEGIRTGDARAQLLAKYDRPDRQLTTTAGTYLIYSGRQMMFLLNGNGQVAGWAVYRNSEK